MTVFGKNRLNLFIFSLSVLGVTLGLPALSGTEFKLTAGLFERDLVQLGVSEKNKTGLLRALAGSLAYYKTRPKERLFPHGSHKQTARDQVRSLELFARLIREHKGEHLEREILKRFRFLESANELGGADFTGYYDPLVQVRDKPSHRFNTPVYGRPLDLIEVRTMDFRSADGSPALSGAAALKGRIQGNRLIPYFTRQEILSERFTTAINRPLFYANDVDLHFFQLQGGGLVRTRDDKTLRLAYAGDNGHAFVSLYARLKGKCKYTRRGIRRFLLSRPDLRAGVMNENPRYVFFKKTRGAARGDTNIRLTAGHSVAMDPRLIPRGALVYLRFAGAPGTAAKGRFALVQDRGSAIRGHGRADLYFGAGSDAEQKAWSFQRQGRIFLLVPRRTGARKTAP